MSFFVQYHTINQPSRQKITQIKGCLNFSLPIDNLHVNNFEGISFFHFFPTPNHVEVEKAEDDSALAWIKKYFGVGSHTI